MSLNKSKVHAANQAHKSTTKTDAEVLAWAVKKYSPELLYRDGENTEKQAITAARLLWNERVERKAAKEANVSTSKPPGQKKAKGNIDAKAQLGELIASTPTIAKPPGQKKNDAMEALADAAAKKKRIKEKMETAIETAVKTKKEKAREKEVDNEISKSLTSLKVTTNSALQNALNAFIDGPIKMLAESFISLYVSRNTNGDSIESATALDNCRIAFDACGLLLVDVEVKKQAPTKIEKTTKAKKETK